MLFRLIKMFLLASLVSILVGSLVFTLLLRASQKESIIVIRLLPLGGQSRPALIRDTTRVLEARLTSFKRRFRIRKWTVTPEESADDVLIRISVFANADLSHLVDLLARRGAIELKVVKGFGDEVPEAEEIPEGCEIIPLVERYFSLKKVAEIVDETTPLLVNREPDLLISSFKAVSFSTEKLRRTTVIDITFHEEDADAFARLTSANVGERVALIIDGEVKTAPKVDSPVTEGRVQIKGIAHEDDARVLAELLRVGALPCSVEAVLSTRAE